MARIPQWNGFDVTNKFRHFVEHIESKGFEYLSCGSFRDTYRRGNVVIKVPQCSDGMLDNLTEARAYRTYKNGPTSTGVYLAPCRILSNGCLMMVLVDTGGQHQDDPMQSLEVYDNMSIYPDWVELIDGTQVGFYKGRVVAYDYALDLPERFGWEQEWDQYSEYFNTEEWAYRSPSIKEFLDQQELEETG